MTTYSPLTITMLSLSSAVESAIAHARRLASDGGEAAYGCALPEIEQRFRELRISLESPEIGKAIRVLRQSCREI